MSGGQPAGACNINNKQQGQQAGNSIMQWPWTIAYHSMIQQGPDRRTTHCQCKRLAKQSCIRQLPAVDYGMQNTSGDSQC